MSVNYKPTEYHTITPYLIVKGADKLISFLVDTFDAQQKMCMKDDDGSVRHAEIRIGDSLLMISEAREEFPANDSMLHLYVPDVDATFARAIENGATSLREPKDEVYGDRSAGVRDALGNQWWMATHIEDVSPEEVENRYREMES